MSRVKIRSAVVRYVKLLYSIKPFNLNIAMLIFCSKYLLGIGLQVGFDNGNYMCCYGAILARPGGDSADHQCCQDEDGRSEAFNNQSHMCCSGTINERPSGSVESHKCCGTQALSQETASCKNGIIVPNL